MMTLTITGQDVKVSDGYRTFDELYEHRIALYIALCRQLYGGPTPVWRSVFHSDGTSFPGWFVLGINTAAGEQITYHLPMIKWDKCEFAETLDRAPEFDGHTAADVLLRIGNLSEY